MPTDETLDPTSDGTPGSGGTGPRPGILERPGAEVGPYRLVRAVGEGGFGEVWLAERRHPFVQQVALKIVKPGMDSKAVIARFEQERQALALMNHPNIAKVLDGGMAANGRPYFAMEYVKGQSITDFCDRHRLDVKDRLRVFLQVCEAVQHAHTKGIIHRDLKPSNVIVSMADEGHPIAKVIDFGIAKAVTGRMTDRTVYTETGQMVGTPEYMSPEQAEAGELDIDTRTDVYSLGVILYELLAGALPFDPKDLRSRAYREIQRVIREEDPPAPSVRLSAIATRDVPEGTRIAAARQQTARQLQRMLKSELEWIPLKAIRKDRRERYASADALGADVGRYLNGEVLDAGPTSPAYRIGKWLARRELPIALGLVAVGWLLMPLMFMPLAVVTGRAQLASATSEKFASGAIAAVLAMLIPTGVFLLAGRLFIGRTTSAIQRLAYIATVLLPGQLLSVVCLTVFFSNAIPDASGLASQVHTVVPLILSLPLILFASPLIARRMRMPVLKSTAVAWLAVILGACAPAASLAYVFGAAASQLTALVESRSAEQALAKSDLETANDSLQWALLSMPLDDPPFRTETDRPNLAIAAALLAAHGEADPESPARIQRAVIRDLQAQLDGEPDMPWRRVYLARLQELNETLQNYEYWRLGRGALHATMAAASSRRGNMQNAIESQRVAVKLLRDDMRRLPEELRELAKQELASAEEALAGYEAREQEDRKGKETPGK